MDTRFEIFLTALPGLEHPLAEEVRALGYTATVAPGGVTLTGGWDDIARLNLHCRGATRILARIAEFRALHLAQLDKRARKLDWGAVLRPDVPVRVEATCRASRIYHDKAATQRIARAIHEDFGAPQAEDAPVTVKARIEDDLCTISVDTSGAPLHKRGHKQAVGKAPLRETMAALFLRQCGFDGTEPVLDPMCGSGTFPLEAADIAAGLAPGRSRAFAFEQLATHDPARWDALRADIAPNPPQPLFFGSDRDAGAVRMAQENAARAGLSDWTQFTQSPVAELTRPDTPPGLVMINPPYGARISNKKMLFGLHATLGARLKEHFSGWRVGIVTSDGQLARATGLPFNAPGPYVAHGGLKIRLWSTGPLP